MISSCLYALLDKIIALFFKSSRSFSVLIFSPTTPEYRLSNEAIEAFILSSCFLTAATAFFNSFSNSIFSALVDTKLPSLSLSVLNILLNKFLNAPFCVGSFLIKSNSAK